MFTSFWVAVGVFWVIGLVIWNRVYPKITEERSNEN